MRGIVFDGKAPRFRDDLPVPPPGDGEVLLRVDQAGICKTDLEILKGYMGFTGVMGHEFVGTVVDGPPEWINRRVAAEINCPCRRCPLCERGLGNHCPARGVLGISGRDGCFAEYIAVPTGNLHDIPDGVVDDAAVFVEPLAAAFQIVEQTPIEPSDDVIVLGDGRLGLLCAMALRGLTDHLLLVGKHPHKLKLAGKRGIETVLASELDQRSAELVVEATGSPAGFAEAIRRTRPRGRLILKSTVASESGMNLAPLVVDEITVIGSRCGPFERAIPALEDGRVDPRDMISARYPLAEGIAALQAAALPENLKVVLDV